MPDQNFSNERYRQKIERLIRAGLRPLRRTAEIRWTIDDFTRSVTFDDLEIIENAPNNYSVERWYAIPSTHRDVPPDADSTTIFQERRSGVMAVYDAIRELYRFHAEAALDGENEAMMYEEFDALKEGVDYDKAPADRDTESTRASP